MRVTYYHRRPFKDHNFSIERVFTDVRRSLPPEIDVKIAVSSFESRKILPRVFNVLEAAFNQGDINHITGDVHFLPYLLKKNKTLLTIMDCVTLERLKGLRKKLFFFLWYWLPEKRTALISAISNSTKQELLRYLKCNPDKIRVVYCPVSDLFKPSPLHFNASNPIILQVGVSENKNIFRLVKALNGMSCHLRIIGKLTEKQITSLEENNIEYSNVFNISEVDMVREYQNCDMVVLVSTYEGFGLPIIEANATGRPVVTSNIYSMPEVAENAACIVDPFDTAAIRAGIVHIIEDAEYREELIKNGYKNVMRFQPKEIALQYLALYKELLENIQLATYNKIFEGNARDY